MITVAVERSSVASPRTMIDRIWAGLEWTSLRAGMRGLAIEYDDGEHQSVQVCLDWGPRIVALSIMRFRDSACRISSFYSLPPQGVIRQQGLWEARAVDDGCRLRLLRSVELRRGSMESPGSYRAREQAYEPVLRRHLHPIMDAVAPPTDR